MSLSHSDEHGRAHMVDVSDKPVTRRTAVASGFIRMSTSTIEAIKSHKTPKGDPLEAARLAGVMAAKRTADLIPLCHPLPITHVEVNTQVEAEGISVVATVTTDGKTGVEMEALMAASIAALTVYDMCKALEKGMVITDIRLELKTGGKSGEYRRQVDVSG